MLKKAVQVSSLSNEFIMEGKKIGKRRKSWVRS